MDEIVRPGEDLEPGDTIILTKPKRIFVLSGESSVMFHTLKLGTLCLILERPERENGNEKIVVLTDRGVHTIFYHELERPFFIIN